MKDPIPLRAGPLTAQFTDGALLYVQAGGSEALRRIYVAVRDQYWDTIEGELSALEIENNESSFAIKFRMRHRQNEIDFEWAGEIRGEANGSIAFSMEGEAHSTFWRNRIGFCVLHPVEGCAGLPCTIEHTDGGVEHGNFPDHISPHQPFQDIHAIRSEIAGGARLTVRFEGDVFEMEDQRNWTDASYKTYCTPLAAPRPVEVHRGDKIRQRILISFDGEAGPDPLAEPVTTLTLSAQKAGRLPSIGLGLASHREPLGQREIARLRRLNLNHLRVELDLSRSLWRQELERGAAEARAIDASLEIALFLSDRAEEEALQLNAALSDLNLIVERWLVFHHDEPVTSKATIELARKHLASLTPKAEFGGGTNFYFTELNRNRPIAEAFDVLSYSINPQVHAFDDLTLIENLAGQAETLRSARRVAGPARLAISPVTLKPRFNPNKLKTRLQQDLNFHDFSAAVDPRQSTLFAAAWTLGSLKYLAEGGADSLTFYETTGWRGVMERGTTSTGTEASSSRESTVFPLYHVLADAGEFAGGEILSLETTDPLKVVGCALRHGQHTRLMLANLTSHPQAAAIHGVEGALLMRRLHEDTLEEAMMSPEAFRARRLEAPPIQGGRMRLALLPYEVICIF